jgi:hypothetical protein
MGVAVSRLEVVKAARSLRAKTLAGRFFVK